MRKLLRAVATTALLTIGAGSVAAHEPDRLVIDHDAATRFATLPDGVRFPEGLAGNPATGDIFVATFDFNQPNKVLRFDRHGQLRAIKDFGGTPLLGLAFDTANRKVYILNFGASKLQRLPADFNATTPVEDVAVFPPIGAPGQRSAANPDGSADTIIFGSSSFPAPNAMTFTRSGSAYISDSFQGAIYRIDNVATCKSPCFVSVVSHDPQLATAGFPPFGANGLALDADETALFIANTGDNRVLHLDLRTGEIVSFAESVHGADGVVADGTGRLWVAANQGDQIIGLNENGRVIARLGEFKGIARDGAPIGLLFPASPIILGEWMYVTNLALALTGNPNEWEADVRRWTIARVKLPKR
jgi:DNA-binding beta-propeller fold protein YncE